VRQQVGPVRQHVDVKANIRHIDGLEERRPRCNVDVERHDARVIGAEPELARRAEHAVRGFAADLPLVEFHAARQRAAGARKGVERPHRDDRGAADHVEDLTAAVVDLRDPERVRVGMATRLHDASDHHVLQVIAQSLHAVHGRHVRGQEVPDLLGAPSVRDERAQPIVRDQHALNCSRKRTSES
jgi:hypothetical protein